MAVKLSDLSIDIRQLGTQFILTGISDDYRYENGQKTGERLGTRYEVAIMGLKLEKMNVKVPGSQMVPSELLKDGKFHNVTFKALEVHYYATGRGYALTGKADSIALAE